MAAGLLLHAGYDAEQQTLVDPMCGSGTFAIEAALIATNTAPGTMRAPPPLLRWADHDPSAWRDAVAEAEALRREVCPAPLLARLRPWPLISP